MKRQYYENVFDDFETRCKTEYTKATIVKYFSDPRGKHSKTES